MVVILGAGISGISASYHLNKKGIDNIVFEQDDDWGGLCGNFEIKGFRFDKAIHLSFTKNKYVEKLFSNSTEFISHEPLAYNYYKGYWLKHPVQNNLKPLKLDEKIEIISDFVKNQNKNVQNYEDWLRVQYGDYFSENFPLVYTKKYWTLEAKNLSTTWLGERMYKPNIKEVLRGAFKKETPNVFYAKQMRYPRKNGYKAFFQNLRKDCDIRFNKKVIKIDTDKKIVYFKDGTKQKYSTLISSIPLPEYTKLLTNMPEDVKKYFNKLKYTSLALVSLGFKRKICKYLWFYVYDEDILFSRVYSPSMKSSHNVPDKCSSLQFEIYFSKDKPLACENLVNHVVEKSQKMKLFKQKDIKVWDFRVLKYANIIYYLGMEQDRLVVEDFLQQKDIKTIGRFGKWEYLWSDQALMSGKDIVKGIS